MSDRAATIDDDAHADAAEAAVERALARCGEDVKELRVLGSAVPGEHRGLSIDVDVLLVPDDANERETAEALRDVAYDVLLEHGPVVEPHVPSATELGTFGRGTTPS